MSTSVIILSMQHLSVFKFRLSCYNKDETKPRDGDDDENVEISEAEEINQGYVLW